MGDTALRCLDQRISEHDTKLGGFVVDDVNLGPPRQTRLGDNAKEAAHQNVVIHRGRIGIQANLVTNVSLERGVIIPADAHLLLGLHYCEE